jgi:hypothetical protein
MRKSLDHPFDSVLRKAGKLIEEGATVYQKFTCAGCGQRLGMDEPNTFHTKGSCDQCSTITDIKKQGCNFMAVFGGKPCG